VAWREPSGLRERSKVMNEERRDSQRYPSFSDVELIATDSSGSKTSLPVMLRDESDHGFGGVYIGPQMINIEDEYRLRQPDSDDLKTVKLAWVKKVAKYVYLLGIEVQHS
jgi:hypothetical protein